MNPPFHIPFAVKIGDEEQVLSIKQPEEEFVFRNLTSKPVPSLLRRFSAPVILDYPFTEEELVHLMGRDDDAFNRWEADSGSPARSSSTGKARLRGHSSTQAGAFFRTATRVRRRSAHAAA